MILVYILAFYGTCHALAEVMTAFDFVLFWREDRRRAPMLDVRRAMRRERHETLLPGERLIERVK